jgi:hypothetical protein
MEFLGGFVGVTQDPSTLSLRPKLGWAVRQGSDLDQLFVRLSKHKPTSPLDAPDFDARIAGFKFERRYELPGEFLAFYKHCNGVSLFGNAIRFLPLQQVELVKGITTQLPAGFDNRFERWNVGPWVRFCDLADGTFVAAELRHTYEKGWKVVRKSRKIIPEATSAVGPEADRIVAWSFQEFLETALNSSGRLDMIQEVP